MFPEMLALLAADDAAWYGPATVTFPVQFAGDPFDRKRNDVWVRFLGERNEREERPAVFDPALGAWRATLYAQHGGRYRAILYRKGKDGKVKDALVEPTEGIVEIKEDDSLGIVRPADRTDRLTRTPGGPWVGLGANLGPNATPDAVDALARAGATWVRLALPDGPMTPDTLEPFGDRVSAVARNGLFLTLALPAGLSEAWRNYAIDRFGYSPRLVGWETADRIDDPWNRTTTPSATSWNGLFENRPGPFYVKEGDLNRIKALRTLLDGSDWADWAAPRLWKGEGAKGVAESDRLILVAEPGAKLTGLPLAEGAYDLTTLDPATGGSTLGTTRVEHATLNVPLPAERFFVLRRRL